MRLMEELLPVGGSVEFTATGNSMRPMLFDKGSKVRLRAPNLLRRGDVILYRRENGEFVLHRIVKAGEELTVCGDAQWHPESGIRRGQVLAVMTDFTYHGRWVSCENGVYRLYRRVWLSLRPLRHLCMGALGRIRHADAR